MLVKRYRYSTLTAVKIGLWRETRRQALEDVAAAEMAEVDDAALSGVQLSPRLGDQYGGVAVVSV